MGQWKSPHPRADHSQPDHDSGIVIITTFQIYSAPHPWDLMGHLNLTPNHRNTLLYKQTWGPFYGDMSMELLQMGRCLWGSVASCSGDCRAESTFGNDHRLCRLVENMWREA